MRQSPFVVYAKPLFGGPARVLAYLARYTHRTAIANSRLVAVDDNEVAFVYKDYRRSGRSRIMRLAPHEFIRRFLLHVLPDGLHRIRHYGFLAKGERGEKLAYVRDLLQVQRAHEPDDQAQAPPKPEPEAGPLTNRSPSARIAAASCAAWGASRRTNPAPFAATHHDHERRPISIAFEFPRRAIALPAPRFSAWFALLPLTASTASSSPPPEPPKRSPRMFKTFYDRPPPHSQRMPWRSKSNRRRFPIAANRPAPSFNPAYMRSPLAMPNLVHPRPHITLQIHLVCGGL